MCHASRRGTQRRHWAALIVLFAVTDLPVLRGQSGDSDTGEVSAFGGTTFAAGVHGAVGATTGLAFSRYGIGLFEVAYSPLGNDTMRHRTGVPVETSRLFDFNAGFHIRVPVKERWAPYGIIGAGLLFDSFRAVVGAAPPTPGGQPQPGGIKVAVEEFNFGFHTGGGLRYYVRPDWGIRPEFKVIVSNRVYTRFTVGIFYNLPAGWPW